MGQTHKKTPRHQTMIMFSLTKSCAAAVLLLGHAGHAAKDDYKEINPATWMVKKNIDENVQVKIKGTGTGGFDGVYKNFTPGRSSGSCEVTFMKNSLHVLKVERINRNVRWTLKKCGGAAQYQAIVHDCPAHNMMLGCNSTDTCQWYRVGSVGADGNSLLPPGWANHKDPKDGTDYYVSPDGKAQWAQPLNPVTINVTVQEKCKQQNKSCCSFLGCFK